MKYFYWGPYTGFVGTIQGMVNSAAATRRAGHEVCLIRAYEEWSENAQEVRDEDLRVIDLGLARLWPGLSRRSGYLPSRLFSLLVILCAPWRLARQIDREKPEVLVTCLLAIPALLAVALARHKPKVVSIIWGFPGFLLASGRQGNPLKRIEGRVRRFFWQWLYRRADRIAAVSNGTLMRLGEEFPFAREKLFRLNAPIALPRLQVRGREACAHRWLERRQAGWSASGAVDPAGPVLLAVGRLSFQKGQDTLLSALAKVREEIPARLIVLGLGENEAALREQARQLKIDDAVDFAGFTKNPFAFFSRADAFVISSRWEDLCHVIIEAACVGVPIVTTDCPSGPGDFVRYGEAGEVCAVDDVDGMAAAILRALRAPDHGAAKARLAYDCAQEYTPESHYRQLAAAVEGMKQGG